MWLDVSHNNISHLRASNFETFPNLQTLNIAHNDISVISSGTFNVLKMIRVLLLKGNCIEILQDLAFQSMSNVVNLDISNNRINTFDPHVLKEMKLLRYLDISKNYIMDIKDEHLADYLQEVKADHRSLCCIARQVHSCIVNTGRPKLNCHFLLHQPLLRGVFWTISALTVTLNIIVIIIRIGFRYFQNIPNIPLTSLALADTLFSVHFLSICIVDALFYGTYGIKLLIWEKSTFCRILSFSSNLSSTVSLTTAVGVSILYLLKFGSYAEVTKKGVIGACVGSWFLAAGFASIMLSASIYISLPEEDTCFGFKLGVTNWLGWKYAVAPQFLLFAILIIVFMASVFKTIHIINVSSQKIAQHGNIFGKRNTKQIVGVFVAFLLSSLVSWIPVIILMVFTMAGQEVDQNIVTWLVVTTLTGNAITNPFLHTIRHLISRRKKTTANTKI